MVKNCKCLLKISKMLIQKYLNLRQYPNSSTRSRTTVRTNSLGESKRQWLIAYIMYLKPYLGEMVIRVCRKLGRDKFGFTVLQKQSTLIFKRLFALWISWRWYFIWFDREDKLYSLSLQDINYKDIFTHANRPNMSGRCGFLQWNKTSIVFIGWVLY